MHMKHVTAIALAVLIALAGCSGTTNPTTTTTATDVQTTTETLSPPTTTATTETTQTPEFTPSVRFVNCTAVEVNATQYEWVGILTATNATEHSGDYSGTNTYHAEGVIQTVLVSGPTGEQVERENPAYGSCREAREPTTTRETTTVVTTTTEVTTVPPTTTTTTTPEPTTTSTPTPTPTTTTTTVERPPLDKDRITTSVRNESLGENATATIVVTNYHDTAVAFDYDVVWYEDRDIMADVSRTPLVLGEDESARVVVEYNGSESIEAVEYVVNNLEYAEDNQ